MWTQRVSLLATQLLAATQATCGAPNGFPQSGNGLWYNAPGVYWGRDFLPVGNGYLAAMTPGGTTVETTQLNIESLWSGGPFQNSSYNGGNKLPSDRHAAQEAMDRIRRDIFSSETGTVGSDALNPLMVDQQANYGAYAGAGYLFTTIDASGKISDYARWLDLDQAVARTTWTQGGVDYNRTIFCSHPAQACVEHIAFSTPQTSSSASSSMPQTSSSTSQTSSSKHPAPTRAPSAPSVTFAYSVAPEPGLPPPNVTCLDDSTLRVRGYAGAPGMLYEILFRVLPGGADAAVSCAPVAAYDAAVAADFSGASARMSGDTAAAPANATLTASGAELSVVWVGGTEYAMDGGDEAHAFAFRGPDPHEGLLARLAALRESSAGDLLDAHLADVDATLNHFRLDLGQGARGDVATGPRSDVPTGALLDAYETDKGDPYLEWLLFNYGRYLLWSSARGTLPANLQGKWAQKYASAWSADYHANINIQMNLWCAEMTGLDVSRSMFDYIEKTWVPRGTQTAQNLYNIDAGWTTHNEMNIFGHTGMKLGDPQWANYPEANAWMMLHVWDHYDYTNDVGWWKSQGYPLLKGAAQFHLAKLVVDAHFNDSSLVVAPCNSPEQKPVTFGCAHAQQLIWQLFNAVEKGFEASGDEDDGFLESIRAAREKMDDGIHVGSWGQLQEWKVDMDDPADTHRHLSHLIGLYPGYALTSYNESAQGGMSADGTRLRREQVLNATAISLAHRGNGTGPDGDAGWEKMWRAAAWAQLGDAEQFYHELTYAIATNFAENLFSVYNPGEADPIFQIDANLGHPAAVLNALVQAPDTAASADPLVVALLPALPRQWPEGAMRGARLRGGMSLDMAWSAGKLGSARIRVDEGARPRLLRVVVEGEVVKEFVTEPGMEVNL